MINYLHPLCKGFIVTCPRLDVARKGNHEEAGVGSEQCHQSIYLTYYFSNACCALSSASSPSLSSIDASEYETRCERMTSRRLTTWSHKSTASSTIRLTCNNRRQLYPPFFALTNLQSIIDTTEQRQNDAIVSQKRFAQRVHKIRLRQQNLDGILRALGQETLLQDGRQLEERP